MLLSGSLSLSPSLSSAFLAKATTVAMFHALLNLISFHYYYENRTSESKRNFPHEFPHGNLLIGFVSKHSVLRQRDADRHRFMTRRTNIKKEIKMLLLTTNETWFFFFLIWDRKEKRRRKRKKIDKFLLITSNFLFYLVFAYIWIVRHNWGESFCLLRI